MALAAILQCEVGRRPQVKEFPIARIQTYAIETAIDNDADQFSFDLGDPDVDLGLVLDRDTETRVTIFDLSPRGVRSVKFTGIADQTGFDSSDQILSIVGRDLSCLATDSDAPPGRFRKINVRSFIAERAHKVGFSEVRIPDLSVIQTDVTDGSETEWELWYRLVRQKKAWLWTEPNGALVADFLAYDANPSYFLGVPRRNTNQSKWIPATQVKFTKSAQGRIGEVWVYYQDKGGTGHVVKSVDTTIKSWKRHPLKVMTSTKATNLDDAKKEADDDIYDSIVGATEIEVTIKGRDTLLKQNRMCQVNFPDIEVVGNYFVVGTREEGGTDGRVQVVRLREKGFALTRRIPPKPKEKDEVTAAYDPDLTTTLGDAVTPTGKKIRWAHSFIRATREFGVPAGWNFSLFLGALLAICQQESSFQNIRERSSKAGTINGVEWSSMDDFIGKQGGTSQALAQLEYRYRLAFANKRTNPLNPRYPSSESGIGPMQLTTPSYKDWADAYGWNDTPVVNEYRGGRWNPDSNIRAAARALVEKGQSSPAADPTDDTQIWIAVSRYHGSPDPGNNRDYVAKVKGFYTSYFQGLTEDILQEATQVPAGTTTTIPLPNGDTLELPDATPDEARAAINFGIRLIGKAYYTHGGDGTLDAAGYPKYDCSSFVCACLEHGSARINRLINGPVPGVTHGDNTDSLYRAGRFQSIPKDDLLPGDMVFFYDSIDHMGMYLADGLMIHTSSTGTPVHITSINNSWYGPLYAGARRVVAWPTGGD